MQIINFICPECGHDRIEEIMEATAYTEVTHLSCLPSGEVVLEFGDSETDYTEEPNSYGCANCQYFLAYSPEGLAKWLSDHEMLSDEQPK